MSEFGRGYISCLFMFANHSARINLYASGPMGMMLWANGASDHLYELVIPDGVPGSEWDRARLLADEWIDIGHGRGLAMQRNAPSVQEAKEACVEATTLVILACTRLGLDYPSSSKAAVAADLRLGIADADDGDFGCPVNL